MSHVVTKVLGGIAALGAIFQSALARHLIPKLAGTPAASHASSIAHAVAAGGTQRVLASTPAAERAQASVAIHSAFVSAMNDIFLVGGIIALTGAALAFLLVRRRDFVTYRAPEAAPAAAG